MTVSDKPYWTRTPQGSTKDRLRDIARIVDEHDEKLTVRAITYKLYGEETHGKDLNRAYNRTCKDVVRCRVLGLVDWGDISEERVISQEFGGFDNDGKAVERFLDRRLSPSRLAEEFVLDRSVAHERPIAVWFEKATVVDYFREVCVEFGVDFVCTRGQLNWTTKRNAARSLDSDTVILYWGDNDEKGHEIRDVISRDLQYLAEEIGTDPPTVEWAGVTEEHEARFDLPSESRLDGVDPAELKTVLAESIRAHVDVEELNRLVEREQELRDQIRERVADAVDLGGGQ